MIVETYTKDQKSKAKRVQRRLERMLLSLAVLRDRLDAYAIWTEDNVDAPSAVQNLMHAQGLADELIESIGCECSRQFLDRHKDELESKRHTMIVKDLS